MIALLNGHSLTKAARFQAESFAMNLTERGSTATIVIGPAAPDIIVDEWLLDEDEPGAGIVWRVKSIDTQYETETRTIQLEHAINSLRDKLMFGEITPKTITGNNSATTCTAQETIEYILSRQSDWVLGQFSYGSVTNPYNFNGEDLFSAIETVSSSLDGCWWSYDMSSYPFTLNITQRATAVSTELRMSRNIQTAKMTIDESRMYTRLYPIGKNNLHIDGDCVSRNTEIYGVKEKTETDQSKGTKEELLRWANEKIKNHCEPAVTVTVTALDLSEATGESIDHITIGAMCRVPLAKYNTTIEEIITKISYQNKLLEPDRATVTMANIREDVASIINNLIKSGGGGGRAAAKNAEEDHAWFVDTNDHVAMIAEGIAGEGAAQDWSRVAELLVDGNGIHQRVTQAQEDIVNAYSVIDQTTTAIRTEIGTVASEVRSFIEQTPGMIHSEVGYAVSGFAHSVIEQTASYIRSEVSNAASAITQTVVEQTTEYVRTEVSSVASGVAWSVITQTMTNIEQKIARKSKVYIQLTDPNDGVNELYNGDIWIKAESLKTWNDHSSSTWNSQNAKEWRSKYGDKHYVWRDGVWVMTLDTSTMVENEVELEQTKDSLSIVGTALDISGERYNSRLEVTAKAIRSEVSTANSRVYSVIEQTATQIRSVVADEVNGLQSSIMQTAGQIRSEVTAAKSTIYSSITQTASQIRSEVASAKSGLYSSITQTAGEIRSEVTAAKSTIYSSITQTASQIRSEVASAKSGIYSSITQTASQIRSEIATAKSGLYSSITQTAGQIRSEVASAKSGIWTSITQNSNKIAAVVDGSGNIKPAQIVAAINNGLSSIKLSADHIDIDGLVNSLKSKAVYANYLEVTNGIDCKHIDCTTIDCTGISTNVGDVMCGGKVDTELLKLGQYDVSWKSTSIQTVSLSNERTWLYGNAQLQPTGRATGKIAIGSSMKTIYYLGR